MSDDSPRHLYILSGGAGDCVPSRPAPRLVVLDAPMQSTPQQLALCFVAPRPAALISLGTEELSVDRLTQVVRQYRPRLAVDVRLSPSFATWGLTRPIFNSILAEHNIEYRRWPELANHFVGDFLDYRLTLESYARYLAGCDAVRQLHDLISGSGPLLLLGRLPEHHESERGVLVDAMARIAPNFDLIIA
jgi:hypothetical protein